jgi:hypothetical protein
MNIALLAFILARIFMVISPQVLIDWAYHEHTVGRFSFENASTTFAR